MKLKECAIIFLAVMFLATGCAVMEIEPVQESAMKILQDAGEMITEIGKPAGKAAKHVVEEIGKRIGDAATEEETGDRIEERE